MTYYQHMGRPGLYLEIDMATKKASGVNIPEAQRTTVQVKLRLDVDVAEDLDALAARWGMNRSQCVARLVAMKKHEPSASADNDSGKGNG